MLDYIKVGNKIQSLRQERKLSQEDLSQQLYITRQALSRYETGLSLPPINTLIELSKILNVSFETILCLDEPLEINPDNIFEGNNREFIISRIINNEIEVKLSDVFYQFSPSERWIVLKAIKEKRMKLTDIHDLYVKLTYVEQKYLGGKITTWKIKN